MKVFKSANIQYNNVKCPVPMLLLGDATVVHGVKQLKDHKIHIGFVHLEAIVTQTPSPCTLEKGGSISKSLSSLSVTIFVLTFSSNKKVAFVTRRVCIKLQLFCLLP